MDGAPIIVRTVALLCVILSRWILLTILLSKPGEP